MKTNLDILRKEIDMIDDDLLSILSKRESIVKKISEYKKVNKLQPLDKKRWESLIEDRLIKAKKLNLSARLIKEVFEKIHQNSLDLQKSD